jgi:hypothetical protein
MNITKLPETLDLNKTEALRKAFEYFINQGNAKNFTDPVTKIHFDDTAKFVDYLNSPEIGIPEKTSAKHIGITLENWYETLLKGASTTTEAPQYQPATTSDVPQAGLREVQEAERAFRESSKIEAKQKVIEQTQEFLNQQEQRANRLREILEKQEKIKVKIEEKPVEVELPQKEVEKIQSFKEEAIQNQKTATEQLAEEIKTRIADSTPPEVVDAVAKQTAYDAVQTLVDNPETSPTIQVAYLRAVAGNPKAVKAVVKDPETAKEVSQTAVDLTDFETTQLNQSKKYFAQAFGDNTAKYWFREKVVSISETPTPEYTQSVSLSQIPAYQAQSLSDQRTILDDVKNVGFEKAQTQIGSRLNGFIDTRIAALPEGHLLKSEFASNTLSVFGVGTPVNWVAAEGASPMIKMAVSSGYGPLLGTVQSATGWKLGISKVGLEVGKRAVTTGAAKVATGVVAKTGFKGLIASLGLAGGPVGVALAWLGSEIVVRLGGRILSGIKKFIKEHKELLIGLGALGMIFGNIPIRIISAPLLFAGGGAAIADGGLSMAALGYGILRFLRIFGRNVGITIGTPILVTILVFPVVVTLILFIINSGAYIVPPSPLTLARVGQVVSPYIDVKKTANPPGPFANDDLDVTVEYTVEITAKKSPLTNIQITDNCTVRKESGTTDCPDPVPAIPDLSGISISPGSPYSFTFSMPFTSPEFEDSRVSNSITVTADTPEQSGTKAAGSASIKIGNPPEDCPHDWPVYPEDEPYLVVLQGPHTRGGTHDVIEAIDIFSPDEPNNTALFGNQVKATHQGSVVVGSGGNYGRFVDITSSCAKSDGTEVEVTSRYAHLSAISAITGQTAGKDQVIGLAGSSGTPWPHLHYEFRPAPGPIKMVYDYIPITVPARCYNGGGIPCNVRY